MVDKTDQSPIYDYPHMLDGKLILQKTGGDAVSGKTDVTKSFYSDDTS